MKYAFIERHRRVWPISVQCRVLKVSVAGYREHLFTDTHRAMLDSRTPITYRQYEDIFNYGVPTDGADHVFAPYRGGAFRLAGIKDHKRRYKAK